MGRVTDPEEFEMDGWSDTDTSEDEDEMDTSA
jgi:hypothetical protein